MINMLAFQNLVTLNCIGLSSFFLTPPSYQLRELNKFYFAILGRFVLNEIPNDILYHHFATHIFPDIVRLL